MKSEDFSISKYYVVEPLYSHFHEFIAVEPPWIEDPPCVEVCPNTKVDPSRIEDPPCPEVCPNTKVDLLLKAVDTLDVSMKLDLLQKITADVATHVRRLSEAIENVPSPLITHTASSLFTEPKMEQSF